MLLSEEVAKKSLNFVYSILYHDKVYDKIKSNIMIGLGDLFHRYPFMIRTQIKKIFQCLESESNYLKQTTITVLSHLILSDFLKIESEIYTLILLL